MHPFSSSHHFYLHMHYHIRYKKHSTSPSLLSHLLRSIAHQKKYSQDKAHAHALHSLDVVCTTFSLSILFYFVARSACHGRLSCTSLVIFTLVFTIRKFIRPPPIRLILDTFFWFHASTKKYILPKPKVSAWEKNLKV